MFVVLIRYCSVLARILKKKAWLISIMMTLVLMSCASVPERPAPERPVPSVGSVPMPKKPLQATLVAVGDVMLGGTAAPELAKYGYDYPFVHARCLLQSGDWVFANLEGPLTNEGEPIVKKRYLFRSPPDKVAHALAQAGFNVVSLANNHAMDYGYEGLQHTIDVLNQVAITHVGVGVDQNAARQYVVLKKKGLRLAFLAYSLTFPKEFWAKDNHPGTAFGHEKHIRADVQRAATEADVVVVSFHWGGEGTTKLRNYQKKLGRSAIDAGATVVLGHHPHVLQGIESYSNGIILYSLGNFVFGSYSKCATRSVVARLEFEESVPKRLELIPINVDNTEVVFQPKLLSGIEAQKVINALRELSQPLNTEIVFKEGSGWVYFRSKPENRTH